jgi:hypothetical protein
LRDLAHARYEISLNHFRIKATLGQLTDADLTGLDKWLVNTPK